MAKIRIGTHNGLFHMDELLGVAILKLVHEARGDEVEIVRSRDPDVLVTCTYLVDVGRVYYHVAGRYDHHQQGGAGARPNGIEYASAGLVWRHFGEQLTGNQEVAAIIDAILMVPVDYRDNNGPQGRDRHVVEFADALTTLFPVWDEDDRDEDTSFMEALAIVEKVLPRYIRRVEADLKALPYVRAAIAAAEDPRIIVLEQGCPWHKVVISEAPQALFVVVGDKRKGEWRVECIPVVVGQKELRAPIPAPWRGHDHPQLSTLTGVPEAKSAPKSRPICVAGSREGAIVLAKLAISLM